MKAEEENKEEKELPKCERCKHFSIYFTNEFIICRRCGFKKKRENGNSSG